MPKIKLVILLTGAFFCFFSSMSYAGEEGVPVWLDTIAPVVKVLPAEKWHSSVFHISLSSNEKAALWLSLDSPGQMKPYTRPVAVTEDGRYRVWFYGEDDFGNKSALDSAFFVLDTRPPSLNVSPSSGNYPGPVTIRAVSNEECRFYHVKTLKENPRTIFPDSLTVNSRFEGFVIAVDSSGNRTISEFLTFSIDTTTLQIRVDPEGGVFNRNTTLFFEFPAGASVFYTFDPLAPPKWFRKYENPVSLPNGLSILRYYGKSNHGTETEIFKRQFVIDTIPPRLHIRQVPGNTSDTLIMTSKEKARIRFTQNGHDPTHKSMEYTKPLVIAHRGKAVIKAKAWDDAGNESDIEQWIYTYDLLAPSIKISNAGGIFNKPQKVFFTSNEDVKILYTSDNTPVNASSILYTQEGVNISKEGITVLRYMGIDDVGNMSLEQSATFQIDSRPPVVKVQIQGNINDGNFNVSLTANEPSRFFYRTDGSDPDQSSSVYTSPISMRNGQVLKYLAVDSAGNVSATGTMNELRNPMVSASPEGGVYNRKVKVSFATSTDGNVLWRVLPDTGFKNTGKTVLLDKEGHCSFEYYLESSGGNRSPVKRNEYVLDWTSPQVDINLRKGINDSVIVFFQCSENATIYYTIDGSNPQVSQTTRTAGNKFLQSSDRITLPRKTDMDFAFYAEDAAGNQSIISVVDIFSPRAVPNVPAGADRLYDRVLSVTLNSYDQSTIYFEQHGKTPTISSPVFQKPLTLLHSDTLVAFVVDASGYRGETDTFIYQIDLPPSPMFSISPDTLFPGSKAMFDASLTIDKESRPEKLLFRWDFQGDGVFETEYAGSRKIEFSYSSPGNYNPVLEVKDENYRRSSYSGRITVKERCPPEMASMVGTDGLSFCIDKYEWPNIKGKAPVTNVSWVEAKMNCIDAGKRLCSEQEWQDACNGTMNRMYPYGKLYESGRCPTEGKQVWEAGRFPRCSESGINDMVGNVWEWVEDKDNDYPLMMGGTFKYGIDAQCKTRSSGTLGSRSGETGFRCCK